MKTEDKNPVGDVGDEDVDCQQEPLSDTGAACHAPTRAMTERRRSRSAMAGSIRQDKVSRSCGIDPVIRNMPEGYRPECSRTRKVNSEDFDMQGLHNLLDSLSQTLSLEVSYCNDAASATIITPEQVEINIFIWSRHDKIYIEARGVRGDDIHSSKYARAILEAATMTKLVEPDLSAIVSRFINDQDIGDILDGILQGLESDSMDVRLSGMESLSKVVDPMQTNLDLVVQVFRAVLFGIGPADHLDTIHKIHRIVQSEAFTMGLETIETRQESPQHTTSGMILVNCALQVLVNALDLVAKPEVQQELYDGNRQDKEYLLNDNVWTDLSLANLWLGCLLDFHELTSLLPRLQNRPSLYNETATLAFQKIESYKQLRPVSSSWTKHVESVRPFDRLPLDSYTSPQDELVKDIYALQELCRIARRHKVKSFLLAWQLKIQDKVAHQRPV